MRVWDVSAGYLNRQSLLGEHRELHGLYNILSFGKAGYARHPETLRWAGARGALVLRHAQLAAEMRLRGYEDRTPLGPRRRRVEWPATFVDEPGEQFRLLRAKYAGRPQGRTPLPRSAQELWAHHKYSVLARDVDAYRHLGRVVSRMRRGAPIDDLARTLVTALRTAPPAGSLRNALEHMWGHVSGATDDSETRAAFATTSGLLSAIQRLAIREKEPFLLASTALGELAVYV